MGRLFVSLAEQSKSTGAEVISLGCRLNIAESERMKAMLAGEDDVVVINSCAVTSEAVRQTRQAIRKARRARPDARLMVTGCAADIERDQIAQMPEVDGLIANTAKLDSARLECARNRAAVCAQPHQSLYRGPERL